MYKILNELSVDELLSLNYSNDLGIGLDLYISFIISHKIQEKLKSYTPIISCVIVSALLIKSIIKKKNDD